MPIYILLFTFVSIILMLLVVVFWLINLQFATYKRPPALRFQHLARVTFVPPTMGALLSSVPAVIVAGFLRFIQQAGLFADTQARWTDFGSEVTPSQDIEGRRGRLGLALVILGVIFLLHGAETIISQPSEEEEGAIRAARKERKVRDRLE